MKVKAYCTMRQVQYAFTCRVPVCYKKTTLIIFLLSQSKSQLVKKKVFYYENSFTSVQLS